jgi:polysaccharide biosynthesis/export protein
MKTFVQTSLIVLLLAAPAAAQAPAGAAGNANGGAAAAPAVPVKPDYRLVPGDKLRVEVYKDSQLSQTLQVRPDGKITLPLANDVVAAGYTPTELRDEIVSALKPYISNPTVTVIVVETRPEVFYVMGEVQSSGPQSLSGDVDIVQAIAMAGGFKDFAKTKNVMVRRDGKVIRFNYNDAVKGKVTPLKIQPGDTIVVP